MKWNVITFRRWKVIRSEPMFAVVRPQVLKLYDQSVCVSQQFLGRHFHKSYVTKTNKQRKPNEIKIIVDPEVSESHPLNQSRCNDLRNKWSLTAAHTKHKTSRMWKMSSCYLWTKTRYCIVNVCSSFAKLSSWCIRIGEALGDCLEDTITQELSLVNRALLVSLPACGTKTAVLWAAEKLRAEWPSFVCSVGACLHTAVGSFYLLMPLVTMTLCFSPGLETDLPHSWAGLGLIWLIFLSLPGSGTLFVQSCLP